MTFPTVTDLEFYQARKRPAWAARVAKRASGPSIDTVINAHAGADRFSSRRYDTETHNMCAFVRSWIRRGCLIEMLFEIVNASPEERAHGRLGPNPRKRQALATKWLARIQKSY